MDFNFSVFQEPRGVMRILQFVSDSFCLLNLNCLYHKFLFICRYFLYVPLQPLLVLQAT